MQDSDKELRKNASGYSDPTAYAAIKHLDRQEQFQKLLRTIFYIVNLAGFEVEERIILKDTRTGKIWR